MLLLMILILMAVNTSVNLYITLKCKRAFTSLDNILQIRDLSLIYLCSYMIWEVSFFFSFYDARKKSDKCSIIFFQRCNLSVQNPFRLFNRGIKHDSPFNNTRKVPGEVVKTEGEARGFQPSRGTLRMLMNDKIMF